MERESPVGFRARGSAAGAAGLESCWSTATPAHRKGECHVEAKGFLQDVGAEGTHDFVKNRSLLSFEEYVQLFLADPRAQARNAAQYLRDVMDHFGTEQVAHPSGTIRRFKLFDVAHEQDGRVAGQEEVQNALYRLLGNFT